MSYLLRNGDNNFQRYDLQKIAPYVQAILQDSGLSLQQLVDKVSSKIPTKTVGGDLTGELGEATNVGPMQAVQLLRDAAGLPEGAIYVPQDALEKETAAQKEWAAKGRTESDEQGLAARNSVNSWLFNGYDRASIASDAVVGKMLSEVALASNKSWGEIASAIQAQPFDDWLWWGNEARKENILKTLGVDPAPHVNKDLLQQQQASAAATGQAAQAAHGDNLLGTFVTVAGLGLGFASALGALGAAEAGAAGWISAEGGAGFVGGLAADTAALSSAGASLAGGANAIETGLTTSGGIQSANTGGMFVGSNGMLGGTGNAIADSVLNGAVRGGVSSALTGGDPVTGAVSGGISGGFASVLPTSGIPIVDNAVKGAVSGGVGAAVNGGDIVTGALAGGAAGGAGTAVREAIGTDVGGNTLANAAAGGAAGAIGSAIAGGDVATGLIRGGVTGGTAGALQDAAVDPTVAGAVGTAVGGLINSPTPDAGTPPAQQQQTSNEITSGLGFSVVLPQFQNTPRRDMQWGNRLQGAQ